MAIKLVLLSDADLAEGTIAQLYAYLSYAN